VNINLTLIVQMVVFATLVFAVMKWIWPVILGAMDERERRIAQGLAAAGQGGSHHPRGA
jgi:F-type H+-transporting ATPase subunit b